MTRRTTEDRLQILADIDAAPHGGKQAVLDRHGVSRQTAGKWRKALRDGSLGQPRGRRKHPGWDAAIERMDRAPKVLEAMRDADPALAESDLVPTQKELHKRILDEIADRVVSQDLPWDGEVGEDDGEPRIWEEDVKANARIRLFRRRRRPDAPRTTDWAGDRVTNTLVELCRNRACPCARLCGVPHFHLPEVGPTSDLDTLDVADLRPDKLVCVDPQCVINRFCLPRRLPPNPLHVLVQRPVRVPEGRASKPIAEWTSPEDCPWFGTCDTKHERTPPEDLEIANAVQSTWQPVRLWCVDPKCRHHRRGNPHVHCPKCGAVWPAFVRYRELDLGNMTRDGFEKTDGLCQKCYDEWRARFARRRLR